MFGYVCWEILELMFVLILYFYKILKMFVEVWKFGSVGVFGLDVKS